MWSCVGALASAAVAKVAASRDGRSGTRRVLYVMAQLTQTDAAALHDLTETLGSSGFNVFILSFLQADYSNNKLTLSYNGNPRSAFAAGVPASLAHLRAGFGERKRLLLSIGGWNHAQTFEAIRSAGVPAFVRQLSEEIVTPLGLQGIDLDLEPGVGGIEQWFGVHHEYGKTVVELTNEYKRAHPSHVVTHAPIAPVAADLYAKPTALPGLPHGLLAGTRTGDKNNIGWLNVQLYEGGEIAGGDIAGFYRESLMKPLVAMRTQTGIARPLHFLTPLFEPAAKQPLEFCEHTIAAIDKGCEELHAGKVNGVALWDYRQVQPAIAEWSRGIQTALQS